MKRKTHVEKCEMQNVKKIQLCLFFSFDRRGGGTISCRGGWRTMGNRSVAELLRTMRSDVLNPPSKHHHRVMVVQGIFTTVQPPNDMGDNICRWLSMNVGMMDGRWMAW